MGARYPKQTKKLFWATAHTLCLKLDNAGVFLTTVIFIEILRF